MVNERTLGYLAVAAYAIIAVTLLPSFSPGMKGQPIVVASVPIANEACAEQDWPNIPAECLRGSRTQLTTSVRPVALH